VQSWVWRQLRVELPDDWELLQFTRNRQTGRCAWADRYQFRFELNWREVPGAPDFERMLSDYRSRLEEDGLTDTARIQCSGWQGVSGVLPDQRTTCRYGSHFAPLGCLVEAVFLWPRTRHLPTETAVLASLRPEPPSAAGHVRWQALGMELLTGSGGLLEECTADPAYAQFNFSFGRRRNWERFSRRGMLPAWLRGPVPDWQRRAVPRGFRTLEERQEDRHGHTIARLRAERRLPLLPDLIWGRRELRAAAWVCPRDGRLYQLCREGYGPIGAKGAAEPPPALRCCADLEVTL
jgi:hypothetical protein